MRRESSIELLRIILMFFIVLLHIFGIGISYDEERGIVTSETIKQFFNHVS